MKLLHLVTERFRGLPDGERTFSGSDDGAPAPIVIVSGPPGAGSSTLLQAIAAAKELVGSYGPRPAVDALLRAGASEARVEATWLLNEADMRLAETDEPRWTTPFVLRRGEAAPLGAPGLRRLFGTHPVAAPAGVGGLELFDADRRLGSLPVPYVDESAELGVRARAGADRYRGILPWLLRRIVSDGLDTLGDLHRHGLLARYDRIDALGEVRATLGALLPDHHLDSVEPRDSQIRFVRKDGVALDVAELSSGERMLILFGLSLLRYRFHHGIALIDDVELMLPPNDVGPMVRTLRGLAPHAQIIATSRQPRALTGLPRHHSVVLGSSAREPQ